MERTIEQIREIESNLEKMSITQLLFFFKDLKDTDFEGMTLVEIEIKRRME